MHRRISIVVLALILALGMSLIYLGCKDKGVTLWESGFSVSGTILDSLTDIPVDSVRIATTDSINTLFYTDSTGFYQVARLGIGDVSFAVMKAGYETQLKTFYLEQDLDSVDIRLVPSQPQ